jgi:hypothetical protein
MSAAIPRLISDTMPTVIERVPREGPYVFGSETDKEIQFSKQWFSANLGNLTRVERECVRVSVQTVYTRLIIRACKEMRRHAKTIVNEKTLSSYIDAWVNDHSVVE